MISLYPQAAGQANEQFPPVARLAQEKRPHRADRPWIMSNMIVAADGATAVDGLSGQLGGPADAEMFAALRSLADAIVVGSATAVAEDYRPPSGGDDAMREARLQRGQAPRPRLVVVTARLSVDPGQRMFGDPDNRPLIATVASAPDDRRRALAEVADVVDFGQDQVDLTAVMAELHRQGHRRVLSEGGPSLNGQLVAADLVDEWNLTVAPLMVGGNSKRPATSPEVVSPRAMILDRVWVGDGLLFCRWIRDQPSQPS